MTVDKDGKPAFTLTLRAREQDIRRDKATSNICSNQSLLALFVTIYLSTMGKEGLYEASQMSIDGAHYLYDALVKIPYLSDPFKQPFFKEFTLKSDLPVERLEQALEEKGFLAPFDLHRLGLESGLISFAVTEKRTQAELDTLIEVLGGLS
jgi:glycine dehydrogenase subunit 1